MAWISSGYGWWSGDRLRRPLREIFVDGQKVNHSGAVVVTYDPPKPTMAEYLARRERALDCLDHWLSGGDMGLPAINADGRAAAALWLAKRDRYIFPKRDKRPLALP